MSTIVNPPPSKKVISGPDRTTAIYAIRAARVAHEHVAIRPVRERRDGADSEGFLLPPGGNIGEHLDRAMGAAGGAFPDDNSWEVIGADSFSEEWPGADQSQPGDGCFGDPEAYGEFSTVDNADVPGWMG